MAATSIAAPGTEFGPCLDVYCGHPGCNANRAAATCICRICNDPVGYDVRMYDEWRDQPNANGTNRHDFFIHALCYELKVEEKRKVAIAKASNQS